MNLHLTVQVPRSPDLNQAVDRFQQKLESLLFAFHPDLVQLQGRLVRHTSREGVSCRLNLHLPTGQLSSEDAAANAETAFRAAGEDLLRQLHRHKQRLRETRPRWRALPAAADAAPETAAPAASRGGEAERRADLAGYFGEHHAYLLGFVRRQVALRERLGELPRGWLDPAEVLNEVVLAALEAQPQDLSENRGRWLLVLSAGAIRRLAKEYGEHQHGAPMASLDQSPEQSENQGGDPIADVAAGEEDGDGAAAGEDLRLQDRLASGLANPEENAAAAQALRQLAAAVKPLPRQQRHDWVLHWIEGFRPQELAHISGRSKKEVLASLEQAQAALHWECEAPELLRRHLPLGAPTAPESAGGSSKPLPQRAQRA